LEIGESYEHPLFIGVAASFAKYPIAIKDTDMPIKQPTFRAEVSKTKPNPRNEHMTQRKAAGLTQAEIGREFSKHRTTVGRALRQGFVSVGKAND
jgi:hypothetical protein